MSNVTILWKEELKQIITKFVYDNLNNPEEIIKSITSALWPLYDASADFLRKYWEQYEKGRNSYNSQVHLKESPRNNG